MELKKSAKKSINRVVAEIAKKCATIEANTACSCWGYQPQEPKQVKTLRRF